jgi:anti-sigma regulatory factor (Ser/Thr protein kinase)
MNAILEHDALLFGSDDALVDALVPWLREGLDNGESAVLATTPPHTDRFRDVLGTDEASVSFIPADDVYVQPAQTIAAWRRVLADAAANRVVRTRIVGEIPFGANHDEQTAWTRYESALNAVFERSSAWIVCPYDERQLPTDVIDQAWRTHPTIWHPTRRPSDRYELPDRLLREIAEPPRAVTGPPSLELAIDGHLSDLRESVRAAGREAYLRRARVEELVLAVTELAGNTVRHGGGGGRLALWITEEGVVCEVRDRGGGVNDPLAGFLPPEPGASDGMGLWIARQLSDSFAIAVDDEGTTVRIAVDR